MTERKQTGYFQFCVDLGLTADQTAISQHRELCEMTQQLLSLFDEHQIPVTWASPLSMVAHVVEMMQISKTPHELAILGDASWLEDGQRRAVVIESIEDFVELARQNHQVVNSIVLRDSRGTMHHEIFAKHGLSIVRTPVEDGVATHASRDPVTSRNGCWNVAANAVFPSAGALLGRFDIGFRAKQILRRSLKRKAAEHLSISAAAMVAQPKSVQALTRIVQHVVRLSNAKSIQCETLRQAVVRWQPAQAVNSKSQHSVLRPAA